MNNHIILFNKPYQCLTQFTDTEGRDNLSHYITKKNVYPAGRLDYDSEGLLLLTSQGKLQQQLTNPKYKLPKTYLAQVEGMITNKALKQLERGVLIKTGLTLPAKAKYCGSPNVWLRNPPVRFRKEIPTSWVKIQLIEGKNRQVRKMLAHVGFPCLRLIRQSIGQWSVLDLQPGQWKQFLPKLNLK